MRFLLLLFLTALSGGLLSAQEPLPKLMASFYCFRYAEQLQDVYVQTGKDAYQKVELSTANMIGPIGVTTVNGTITIHRKDTAEDGTDLYPPVGRAKLGTIKRPLIVLFPAAKESKLPYRALTIDRADTKFPLGSYQFLNLSPHAMRGLVGKTKLSAKPGTVHSLRPSAKPGSMMTVLFEYHDGTQWRTMTKTRWAYRKDRRSLICAYLDPRDHRVKMRAIPERLVPPTEKP